MEVIKSIRSYFKSSEIPLINNPLPVEDFENGLNLLGTIIPEEMIVEIMSHIEPKRIIQLGLVCKTWYNISRSHLLWSRISENRNKKVHKNLPWYLFYCLHASNYFKNLIKNGNGEEGLKHWDIIANGGDGFIVEPQPQGASGLPVDIRDFNGHLSCFATSFLLCKKQQKIEINSNLFLHILRQYKPHIHISEWVTGRFDCGSKYALTVELILADEVVKTYQETYECDQWDNPRWTKISIVISNYPNFDCINFIHEGKDKQFWKGHYGTKMAGALLKFDFDSIAS